MTSTSYFLRLPRRLPPPLAHGTLHITYVAKNIPRREKQKKQRAKNGVGFLRLLVSFLLRAAASSRSPLPSLGLRAHDPNDTAPPP